MILRERLISHSDKIKNIIESVDGVTVLDTEDWGWENYRYTSPLFRLAHIERYFLDNLLVLHITVFPHKNDPSPIYGFDIICSEKTNTVMGTFIDLSPILYDEWEHSFKSNSTRILPEWATIFSKNFVALRNPTEDEHTSIFDFSYTLFIEYLSTIRTQTYNDPNHIDQIIKAQNIYCDHQQQNKRTFGALKAKVGEERARTFMETVLFPKI
jgi:hypothetical protein